MSDCVYHTRSGRTVRRVQRYEPDVDTIFVDTESQESQSGDKCEKHENTGDIIDTGSEDEYSISSSSDEEGSLVGTDIESICIDFDLENESDDEPEDEDVLNWETLTTDDESDDQSTDSEEYDEDEDED